MNPSMQLRSISPLPFHCLRLEYETGEIRIFDVTPYLSGSWFGELKDPEYFATVHIIENGSGIEWANGQDIAPHELYELSIPDNDSSK
ncbi:MAG: DUF2442 domain-containing protein [Myxococcales bacterium]|jgi:hypothetical protein|nr:DUF2442 domain-containing protein [Myxococcales bacterium]